MSQFRFSAFLTILLGSMLPDLLNKLLAVIASSPALPYEWKGYLGLAYQVPWQSLVFGACFSLACSVALGNCVRIGLNEFAAMTLLSPVFYFILMFFLPFLGIFLPQFLPLGVVFSFAYAFLLALFAQGFLYVELGSPIILLTAVVGALVSAADMIPNLPFYPSQGWYLIVGSFMGLFAARQAALDSPIP